MSNFERTFPRHDYYRKEPDGVDMGNIERVGKAAVSNFRGSSIFLGILFVAAALCTIPLIKLIDNFYARLLVIFMLIIVPFGIILLLFLFDRLRNRINPRECYIVYGTIVKKDIDIRHNKYGMNKRCFRVDLMIDDSEFIESGILVEDVNVIDRKDNTENSQNRAALVWLSAECSYIVPAVQEVWK